MVVCCLRLRACLPVAERTLLTVCRFPAVSRPHFGPFEAPVSSIRLFLFCSYKHGTSPLPAFYILFYLGRGVSLSVPCNLQFSCRLSGPFLVLFLHWSVYPVSAEHLSKSVASWQSSPLLVAFNNFVPPPRLSRPPRSTLRRLRSRSTTGWRAALVRWRGCRVPSVIAATGGEPDTHHVLSRRSSGNRSSQPS